MVGVVSLVVGTGALIGALGWGRSHAASPPASPPPAAARPVGAPPAADTPSPARDATGAPPTTVLLLPKLHLSAPIESVGIDATGNIGVPSVAEDVAWYDGSAVPGQPGDAIVDGHLDWTTGPAVFFHLQDLRAGDEVVVVQQNGVALHFLVTGSRVYGAASRPPASLFAKSGPAQLSLITCSGPWDAGRRQYQERLVVTAVLKT